MRTGGHLFEDGDEEATYFTRRALALNRRAPLLISRKFKRNNFVQISHGTTEIFKSPFIQGITLAFFSVVASYKQQKLMSSGSCLDKAIIYLLSNFSRLLSNYFLGDAYLIALENKLCVKQQQQLLTVFSYCVNLYQVSNVEFVYVSY